MSRYWTTALACVVIGTGVFLHTMLYSDSWSQRERARKDLEALQSQNATTDERIEGLTNQIDALRNRPAAQERAVRHELGYVRDGEVVLELAD